MTLRGALAPTLVFVGLGLGYALWGVGAPVSPADRESRSEEAPYPSSTDPTPAGSSPEPKGGEEALAQAASRGRGRLIPTVDSSPRPFCPESGPNSSGDGSPRPFCPESGPKSAPPVPRTVAWPSALRTAPESVAVRRSPCRSFHARLLHCPWFVG